MAEVLGTCIHVERDYFNGTAGQLGPKLVFDQMAAPIPEIMDVSLYACVSHRCT
jgi:hypothetical protein